MTPPTELESRIVVDESGCWLWTGALRKDGYGQIELPRDGDGKRTCWLAHRLVAHLLGFALGENMHHRETCPKRCVNPEHLTPLTVAEHAAGHVDEFCGRGHPMADARVVTRPDGSTTRQCRVCQQIREKKRRANFTPEERLADSRARNARRSRSTEA